MRIFALAMTVALSIATPAFAEIIDPLQSEALVKKSINEPGTAYTFYGPGLTSKAMKDADIPGGEFIRVTADKGANPYDAGGGYQINKPIKTGDVIFLALYARAPNLKAGETASLPGLGVSQDGSPYTPIAVADKRITNQWAVYYIAAKSGTGWPKGKAHVALQLAADKQVIDLGPIFLLDLGPDYDIDTLPHN